MCQRLQASRDEIQQSGRPHRQSQEQASHHTGDELSMGQQQREEERGEDPQTEWPPALGIETAVPRLRGATAQHHHRCSWGVVTGDGRYDARDRREQE